MLTMVKLKDSLFFTLASNENVAPYRQGVDN